MTEKILTELNIRTYQHSDMEDVIRIWKECALIRSWNNPKLDIQRKVKTQNDLFFVAELSNRIIATAMFGYDGHRGWLNYFAVLPQFQKSGYGKQLLEFGEKILFDKGCPKINLQIRADNKEAINFYNAVGQLRYKNLSLLCYLLLFEGLFLDNLYQKVSFLQILTTVFHNHFFGIEEELRSSLTILCVHHNQTSQ